MTAAILLLAACLQAPVRAPDAAPPEPVPLAPGRVELGVPGSPRGLAMADLDDDGRDELLVATLSPGKLFVYRGLEPELAPLTPPLQLPFEDYGLGPVVLEDHTLVLGQRSSGSLLLANFDLEDPRATTRHTVALGAAPRALADGGGDLVLVATASDELVEVATGAAPPGVVARHALGDSLPTAVLALDGGVAVASQGTNSLVLYRRDGTALTEAARLELPGVPRDLARVDLDGDGDDELLVVAGTDRAVCLGWGDGGGLDPWLAADAGPPPEPRTWPCGDLPVSLEVADLDRDGRDEVLAVFLADLIVVVLDAFTADGPEVVGPVGAGSDPMHVAVGDLDGDGRLDAAVSSASSGAVSVVFGQDTAAPGAPPGGLTGAPNWAATDAPHAMAAGDLDADGRGDLVLLSALEDRAALLFGGADGLEAPVEVAIPHEADEVVTAELDGRPGREPVMLHQDPDGTQLAALLPADGPRAFVAQSTRGGPPVAVRAEGLLPADLDGDGRDELLVADTAGHALAVFGLELGPDRLRAVERLRLTVPGEPGPMAAVRGPEGELLGLALGQNTATGAVLSLVLRDAAGGLRVVGDLPLPLPVEDVTAGDLDADGNPDLVALCRAKNDNTPGVLQAYLAPSATRDRWTALPPLRVGPKAFAVAAGDLNGDGAAELFASSQYAYRVDAFVGDPVTGLPRASWRLGANRGCMDLALVDTDGDGRVELAVSNNHSADVSLLRFPVDDGAAGD